MKLNAMMGLALAGMAALPAAALQTTFVTTLTGPSENPPNASTATGSAVVVFDDVLLTMNVSTSFAGLIGGAASAAHIHCCAAPPANVGVAVGFTGFPPATSGTYNNVFNLALGATFSATFLANNGGNAAGAFAALLTGVKAGQAYVNIHNSTFPGGEIRGFLAPIPEPETYALMLAGLAAVAVAARRRRRTS